MLAELLTPAASGSNHGSGVFSNVADLIDRSTLLRVRVDAAKSLIVG